MKCLKIAFNHNNISQILYSEHLNFLYETLWVLLKKQANCTIMLHPNPIHLF